MSYNASVPQDWTLEIADKGAYISDPTQEKEDDAFWAYPPIDNRDYLDIIWKELGKI